MIVLGLTGSIGMGKSTVAAMFRRAGVPVFDADAEVHRLQGPAGALVAAIEALFPGTTSVKGVDRGRLGRAVLHDQAALSRLERLIHPAVGKAQREFLRRHRSRPFRTAREYRARPAPAWMQRRRVLARPGMTAAKLAHIRALQTPDAEKRRRADFVIETGVSRLQTEAQVRKLISCLSARRGRYSNLCEKSFSTPKRRA
jgi:dephospho-CoA kinase